MAKGEAKSGPSSVHQFCEHILDLLGEGVYISDRQGNTLAVNEMYERLTGLKKADLVGQHVDTLVQRGFNTVVNPKVVETGKPVTSVQTDRQGNKRVLNGYPILNTDGEVELVVTFVRDVTLLSQLRDKIASQHRLIERYRSNVRHLSAERDKKYPIISASAEMARLLSRMFNVAETDATVLIQGETGVGKDVFAHRIHQASPRSDRPFFKVDCPTIPETLIESELFGYAPGAFSGAHAKGKVGFFEMAERGTLFLDEIGELPLAMQAKLLRVLQDSEILPVGATKVRPVNVRIVAATNRDLGEDVKAGRFRQDLFYRLNVVPVRIAPLRERPEDILPLIDHFLEKYGAKMGKNDVRIAPSAVKVLLGHRWAGNVRELENTIERALALSGDSRMLSEEHFPQFEQESASLGDLERHKSLKQKLHVVEKQIIADTLEKTGWNITRAAEILEVTRQHLHNKIKQYGISQS